MLLHLALLTAVCLLLREMVNGHRAKHTCGYCGGANGSHEQDCPWDYLQRGH